MSARTVPLRPTGAPSTKRRPQLDRRGWIRRWLPLLAICLSDGLLLGGDGALTLKVEEESTQQPLIARTEFYRGQTHPAARKSSRQKQMPVRQTVPAGIGVVVDRQVLLELPDGPYRFRIIRGPEYRIVSGTFELEKTSLDEKTVVLPRMANLMEEGWLSGDCCVTRSQYSLPLRMASEDLHVAASLGEGPTKPIPHRQPDDPIGFDPKWIRSDVTHHQGLVIFGGPASENAGDGTSDSFQSLVAAKRLRESGTDLKVAIENPFAWEVPVWLASGQIDGIFVLGDWLRLDKRVMRVRDGRPDDLFKLGDPTAVGRVGETIYRHALNAGLEAVPLAGGGSESSQTPVGYNRVYATIPEGGVSEDSVQTPTLPDDSDAWWSSVWAGHSVVTNGPLLRPLLAGKLPGFQFTGSPGEKLRLQPELNLAVRDPVDYLEVIHNDRVHYSARLDEFAASGGKIPPIFAESSGWVIIRVLTLHGEHYRASVTAPWWITFGEKRVSRGSVAFFRQWLSDYESQLKSLPRDELQAFVPFVQAARRFWAEKDAAANAP